MIDFAPAETARAFAPAKLLDGWHLLSLDAPTVAVVWTIFVARVTRTALPPAIPAAMFLAVWIIYAADRLIDGTRGVPQRLKPRRGDAGYGTGEPVPLSEAGFCAASAHVPLSEASSSAACERVPLRGLAARHLFHQRHRWGFLAAILAASIALVPLVFAIPANTRALYLGLAGLLGVWLAIIHLADLRIPKELAVGFFFAAAVFVPARHELLLPAILFGNLCSLNCLFIYDWEHEVRNAGPSTASGAKYARDFAQDDNLSLCVRAHATTAFGIRHLLAIAATSILLPLCLIPFSASAPILAAIAIAAALLLFLHHSRRRFDATTLRAAADLALLTPLLLFPFPG